ncbi:hypothetical protein MP228_004927 [Amoeboaphelidium protococcarum]|nr:hypothetical protein MP228_004927 [Amoeboaphelidium protococcarum]
MKQKLSSFDQLSRLRNKNNQPEIAVAANKVWDLDSGASMQCCNDKDALVGLSASFGVKVHNYGGSDKGVVCAGVGTVILDVIGDGQRRLL